MISLKVKVKAKVNPNYTPPASVANSSYSCTPLTYDKQPVNCHDTFYNLNCIINEQTNIIESQQETIEYLQYKLNDREQQLALLLDERATCCSNCSSVDLSEHKVSHKVKVKPKRRLEKYLPILWEFNDYI
jgi:hypothetical protein